MDELIEVLTTEGWVVIDPNQVDLVTVFISLMARGHVEIRLTGPEFREAVNRAATRRASSAERRL